MDTKSLKTVSSVIPLIPVLLVATSCGGTAGETTFEGVEDFMSSMESESYECNAMSSTTYDRGTDEIGEQVLCAEGHSLTVWDEDFDAGETSETDLLVRELEEQGTIEHLRGENWHVMSIDGDFLAEMQQNFGGELNEQGFPDLN